MNCERPYITEGVAFPCGGCLPCRHQRARIWSHRLILEATQHDRNAFVTLTYTESELHTIGGSVNPRHLQLFIKSLRRKTPRFRYYAVGEYGEQTLRPHYHLALFGFDTCERGQTDLRRPNCCSRCKLVNDTWGKGAVQLARLEEASAAYVAGYVTKKLTAPPLPKHLHPEFQRMSLKPGLGHACMHDVADRLLKYYPDISDVPVVLQHGPKKYPLGKYLRRTLRKMMGRDVKCPESVLKNLQTELLPLREIAFTNSQSYQKAILDKNQGSRETFLKRKHIYRQGKRL